MLQRLFEIGFWFGFLAGMLYLILLISDIGAHANQPAYLRARFYVRGWTTLGLFNTLTAALCNRVLVLHKDKTTKRVVGFHIGKGTDHLPTTRS